MSHVTVELDHNCISNSISEQSWREPNSRLESWLVMGKGRRNKQWGMSEDVESSVPGLSLFGKSGSTKKVLSCWSKNFRFKDSSVRFFHRFLQHRRSGLLHRLFKLSKKPPNHFLFTCLNRVTWSRSTGNVSRWMWRIFYYGDVYIICRL